MLKDVSVKQQQINERTKYLSKKLLGRNLFGMGNDHVDDVDDDDDDSSDQ